MNLNFSLLWPFIVVLKFFYGLKGFIIVIIIARYYEWLKSPEKMMCSRMLQGCYKGWQYSVLRSGFPVFEDWIFSDKWCAPEQQGCYKVWWYGVLRSGFLVFSKKYSKISSAQILINISCCSRTAMYKINKIDKKQFYTNITEYFQNKCTIRILHCLKESFLQLGAFGELGGKWPTRIKPLVIHISI